MMDSLDLLRTRQSLRVYGPQPIPDHVRESVLQAAISAPTAGALGAICYH